MWSGLLLGAGACQPATFRTGAGACPATFRTGAGACPATFRTGAGACPATFRTGAGACQPATVVTWLDDDGDVTGALEDAARAAFGPRPDPAHRDALVHKGPRDEQILTLEVAGPLGVRGRARDDLVDGLTGGLGRELEGVQGVGNVQATHQVHDAAHLGRRDAYLSSDRVRTGTVAEQRLPAARA